jgi:hypothetical protein
MEVKVTLKPGQNGTKHLVEQYGDSANLCPLPLRQGKAQALQNQGVSHLIYVVVAGCVGKRWTVQPRYFTA